jgi:citrate synthase
MSELEFPTSLGTSTAEEIGLLGQSLSDDLMGKVGFGELAFWLVALRRPTPGETRVFEAVLVALADHGFTPTAIAARLTYLSAPDSLQGAMAAGLLGGGSRFLGVTEDCGSYLHAVLEERVAEPPADDAGWDAVALEAVRRTREQGRYVPGLGHPVHKVQDPRTPRLIQIADEEGLRGPHLRLFEAIGRTHEQRGAGRPRPPRRAAAGVRPARSRRRTARTDRGGTPASGRDGRLPDRRPQRGVRRPRRGLRREERAWPPSPRSSPRRTTPST